MAASWPKLQHLALGSPLGWGLPSGVTLGGLHTLIKACPELEQLSLSLDASLPPPIPCKSNNDDNLQRNRKITYLIVGDSTIEDARAVADFLYSILPNLSGIGGAWLYVRSGSFTHQERGCHALWQKVVEYMEEARKGVCASSSSSSLETVLKSLRPSSCGPSTVGTVNGCSSVTNGVRSRRRRWKMT